MKVFTTSMCMLLLGLCVVATSTTAIAADNTTAATAGKTDEQASGANLRASQLIGKTIYNAKHEEISEVEDIVLDDKAGKVRYAAVSYGGFLGMGDKLFAVPWAAFKCQKGEGENEYFLVLNVTKEQLEGAQGFNQDNWPNFANRKFTDELDRRYRTSSAQQDSSMEMKAGKEESKVKTDSYEQSGQNQ